MLLCIFLNLIPNYYTKTIGCISVGLLVTHLCQLIKEIDIVIHLFPIISPLKRNRHFHLPVSSVLGIEGKESLDCTCPGLFSDEIQALIAPLNYCRLKISPMLKAALIRLAVGL